MLTRFKHIYHVSSVTVFLTWLVLVAHPHRQHLCIMNLLSPPPFSHCPIPHQSTRTLRSHPPNHPPLSKLNSPLTSHSLQAPIHSYMLNCTHKYAWTQVQDETLVRIHANTQMNTYQCTRHSHLPDTRVHIIINYSFFTSCITVLIRMRCKATLPVHSWQQRRQQKNSPFSFWSQICANSDMEPPFNPYPDYSSSVSIYLHYLQSPACLLDFFFSLTLGCDNYLFHLCSWI